MEGGRIRRFLKPAAWVLVGGAAVISAWPSITERRAAGGGQKVTLVVPYDAGGSTDISTRIVAQKLLDLGLDVVVLNKTGAVGTAGTHWCSQQPPDRGVVCVTTPAALLYNPSIEDTGYTWEALDPIASWGGSAFAFAVKPESPYRSIDDMIEGAKARPRQLAIGSTGTGDQEFIIQEMFAQTSAPFTYVAFRGGAEVLTNLLGGHIGVGYISVATLAPLVRSGQLRMIAHTSPFATQLEEFPDVPHISAYGYFQEAVSFHSLWGPKGMPLEFRETLAAAVDVACRDPWVIAENTKIGVTMRCQGIEATYEDASRIARTIVPGFSAWAKLNR